MNALSRRIQAGLRIHGRQVAAVLLGQVAVMAGTAVGSRVLTGAVDARTFGETKMLQGLVLLATGLVPRPFIQFVMREYHDAEASGVQGAFYLFGRRALTHILLIQAAVLAAGLLVYRQFVPSLSWLSCLVTALVLVLEGLATYEVSISVTRNHQLRASLSESIKSWSGPMFGAFLALSWVAGASSLLVGQAAAALAGLAALRTGHPPEGAPAGVRKADEWSRAARAFVVPLLPLGLFTWVTGVGDRYLLSFFRGPAEVGQYAAVYGLVGGPIVAAGAMAIRFLYPLVFRAAASEDHHRQTHLQVRVTLFACVVGASIILGALLLGPTLTRLFLAPAYARGAQPLVLWIAAAHVWLIVAYTFDIRSFSQKRTWPLTLSNFVSAAVNLGANLILIPRWGARGAAQATFISYLIYLLLIAAFNRRATTTPASTSP